MSGLRGFGVLGLGFEVLRLGFEVLGLVFEVLRLGFEVPGLVFEVLVLGYVVLVPKLWSPVLQVQKTS